MSIEISRIDELRFGVKTAKARAEPANDVQAVLKSSRAQGVLLTILRIPTNAVAAASAAQSAGAVLMDTLCYFDSVPHGGAALQWVSGQVRPLIQNSRIRFRRAIAEDAGLVEAITRDAFHHYAGHYENDARLRAEDSREVYPSWARQCCERATPELPVILASLEGEVSGFLATRPSAPLELDVALLGVCSGRRGQGVGSALLGYLLESCVELGVERLHYSTQITNVPMQRMLSSAGFLLKSSDYTFHHWSAEALP